MFNSVESPKILVFWSQPVDLPLTAVEDYCFTSNVVLAACMLIVISDGSLKFVD